jgi:hypothetical protein
MGVVDSSYGNPKIIEEGAVAPLAGGILQNGYQCGILWGAALAAGVRAHQQLGSGPYAETQAILATQNLVRAFSLRNTHINCSDIVGFNWRGDSSNSLARQILKFFLRGGLWICFSNTANFAKTTHHEINRTLTVSSQTVPTTPVSCASLLARQMGASDMHAVMAAGFAGGIGLSGGACGALGAAIWITGMAQSRENHSKPGLNDPLTLAVLERYLGATNGEFECARVVGKHFADVADHADYLQAGGCAKIIQALAAPG